MPDLLLGTGNRGKIAEYRALLAEHGLQAAIPQDLGITESPEETGKTFEENARIKAAFYASRAELPALADDGGLEIDALSGEPGIYSRRWPGHEASDEELAFYTLARMKGVPADKRTARFRVVLALALDPERISCFSGALEGVITEELHPPIIPGYPYRSVFYAPEIGSVLSEVPMEEIHAAHRRRAFGKAADMLQRMRMKHRKGHNNHS